MQAYGDVVGSHEDLLPLGYLQSAKLEAFVLQGWMVMTWRITSRGPDNREGYFRRRCRSNERRSSDGGRSHWEGGGGRHFL